LLCPFRGVIKIQSRFKIDNSTVQSATWLLFRNNLQFQIEGFKTETFIHIPNPT
jgi:hypothetical protein